MKVKEKITMAEFGAIVDSVVDHCFANGVYDPTYRDFWTEYAMISVFCDYPFGKGEDIDVNDVFAKIYGNNAEINTARMTIVQSALFAPIITAIDRKIEYRTRINNYSMTDMALTNLIDAVSAKIDSMEEIFTAENMQALVDVSQKLSKFSNVSQKKIVSTIIESFDKRSIKLEKTNVQKESE